MIYRSVKNYQFKAKYECPTLLITLKHVDAVANFAQLSARSHPSWVGHQLRRQNSTCYFCLCENARKKTDGLSWGFHPWQRVAGFQTSMHKVECGFPSFSLSKYFIMQHRGHPAHHPDLAIYMPRPICPATIFYGTKVGLATGQNFRIALDQT